MRARVPVRPTGASRVLARKAARGKASDAGCGERGAVVHPHRRPRGRRLILLGFFYGEAEEALRQKINAERRAADGDNPA